MKVYLCGPINGCTDEEAKNWREALKKAFPELARIFPEGVEAVDPMKRDYRGKEAASYREIVDLDKRDIRTCDIVLVNYDKPSVGTSMEVFYAWTLGIPVIVWTRPETSISPWLRYHSTAFVHSLAEAQAKIMEIAP